MKNAAQRQHESIPRRASALLVGVILVLGCCSAPSEDVPPSHEETAGAVTTVPATPPPLLTAAERCPGLEAPPAAEPVVIPSRNSFIFGLQSGSGPRVVVLVHGSGSRGLCVWANEIPWLAKAGYRVVAVDLPCVGNSACPDGPTKLLDSMADIADHIKGTDKSVRLAVVAASAGGPLALHVAAQPKSAFSAAVALSPAGIEAPLVEDGRELSAVEAAKSIRIPTLIATSASDTTVDQQTLATIKAIVSADLLTIEVVPAGEAHAQELLYDIRDRAKPSPFRETFTNFLTRSLAT